MAFPLACPRCRAVFERGASRCPGCTGEVIYGPTAAELTGWTVAAGLAGTLVAHVLGARHGLDDYATGALLGGLAVAGLSSGWCARRSGSAAWRYAPE